MKVRASGRPSGYWGWVVVLAIIVGMKPVVMGTLDPDLFWHVRVGEQLIREGVHPLVDPLSFTTHDSPWAAGQTWVPYSWLAEMGIAWLWDAGGYRAVLFCHALLLFAMTLVLGMISRAAVGQSTTRPLRGGGAALVALGASIPFVVPWVNFRPATMVIGLLAVILWLLLRDRRQGQRGWGMTTLAAIALLVAIGANMHMFIYLAWLWCVALFATACVEWGFARRLRIRKNRSELQRRIKRYGLWVVVVGGAGCATPLLMGMMQAIANYQFKDVLVSSGMITEMRPFWASGMGVILVMIALASFVLLAKHWRRLCIAEVLLLGLGIVLLMMHGRYAPLFGLTLCSPLAKGIGRMRDGAIERPVLRGAAWSLSAVVLVAAVVLFPKAGGAAAMNNWLDEQATREKVTGTPAFPVRAAAWVSEHPDLARDGQAGAKSLHVLTDFSWGGYIAWRLTEADAIERSADERWEVWMDGRTQVRTSAFWTQAILGEASDRAKMIEESGARVGIFPVQDWRYAPVLKELGWRVAFSDEWAMVLVAPK